jgi:hypothetical protein
MSNDRHVVSIRMTGLGDRIICLSATWRFARLTGRILIADWRYGAYDKDSGGNQLPQCFAGSAGSVAGLAGRP